MLGVRAGEAGGGDAEIGAGAASPAAPALICSGNTIREQKSPKRSPGSRSFFQRVSGGRRSVVIFSVFSLAPAFPVAGAGPALPPTGRRALLGARPPETTPALKEPRP